MTQPFAAGADITSCCAEIYASDWVHALLGDSLHPGGLALTDRLGDLTGIRGDSRVLDVAAGRGTSAIHLAARYGCEVVGVEYGDESVAVARLAAAASPRAAAVRFERGDAGSLPFPDRSFDVVICECAFCTFPDRGAAASEFMRVLRPGGRVGLSDLVRTGPLPDQLQNFAARIACIAGASSLDEYAADLQRAGLTTRLMERHDHVLAQLAESIRLRVTGIRVLMAAQKAGLPGIDLDTAASLARNASAAVSKGILGYGLLVAERPRLVSRRTDIDDADRERREVAQSNNRRSRPRSSAA